MPLKQRFKELGFLLLGIISLSIGVSFFFDPSGLTPGGASGLAIALNGLGIFPFGTGTLMLIINIPIITVGIIKFGPKFFAATIVAIIASSGLVEVLNYLIKNVIWSDENPYYISPVAAAIGGGVLVGLSVGLVMRAGATTGGSDVVAKLMHLKYPYMQTGTFCAVSDGVVVFIGTICGMVSNGRFSPENFSTETLIYSVLALFISSYFTNLALYGSEGARMIYIITSKEQEIIARITREVDTGVTYLQGKGAYSGADKKILMCVMRKHQAPKARQVVLEEDPDAFMIVTSANQVLGKGYKALDSEDL